VNAYRRRGFCTISVSGVWGGVIEGKAMYDIEIEVDTVSSVVI
jgi:hypothetical protein